MLKSFLLNKSKTKTNCNNNKDISFDLSMALSNLALLCLQNILLVMIISEHKNNAQKTEECIEKLNSCACKTASGYINLENLDRAKIDGKPKFHQIPEPHSGNLYYMYNPCTAFSESSCEDVAVCLTDGDQEYQDLGIHDSAVFSHTPSKGTTLQYTARKMPVLSVVSLKCDPSEEGRIVSDGASIQSYNFELTTKYACSDIAPPPGGGGKGARQRGNLSPGDILLIVFFSLLVVYLVAGLSFNKFRKGAKGIELLPNVDFWKVLPGLFKDGVKLSWDKVKGLTACGRKPGYDEV